MVGIGVVMARGVSVRLYTWQMRNALLSTLVG